LKSIPDDLASIDHDVLRRRRCLHDRPCHGFAGAVGARAYQCAAAFQPHERSVARLHVFGRQPCFRRWRDRKRDSVVVGADSKPVASPPPAARASQASQTVSPAAPRASPSWTIPEFWTQIKLSTKSAFHTEAEVPSACTRAGRRGQLCPWSAGRFLTAESRCGASLPTTVLLNRLDGNLISGYDITMADLLLRNIPAKTLDSLKARARNTKRSVQAEALELLERGVDTTLGSSVLAWARTVRDPAVDFEPVVRFVRQTRDER